MLEFPRGFQFRSYKVSPSRLAAYFSTSRYCGLANVYRRSHMGAYRDLEYQRVHVRQTIVREACRVDYLDCDFLNQPLLVSDRTHRYWVILDSIRC